MSKENSETSYQWKKEYTMVLVLNALYILIFYFIMKGNN